MISEARLEQLYCPSCERRQPFETPPCPDGHDECSDRACTACGHALSLGGAGVPTATDIALPYASAA